ncbi:hypothetical protein PIB30_019879 [Stylosanthes scabra]|uniref:Uncharacterized protein n=1 Tax=Stylosanthes scabra TaxID=79078 RepID=A0ABU6T8R0_9FABA|nr:hypothetical protein [Stylosanthes scabra]
MAGLLKKRKGKVVAQSSSEVPRFKTLFHEAHFKGKLSARKVLPEVPIDYNDDILSPCAIQIKMRKWEKFTTPFATTWSKNFMPMLGSRTKTKESLTLQDGLDDTLINQELPITGEALVRTREARARNPRQEAPPQQPPQEQPQPQIYRRLDQQQEESRKSFEAMNTRMDRMDD